MIFTLLEIISVIVIFTFFFTEVIWPIQKGTILFPTFRFKLRKLDKELRQAKLDRELAEEQKLLDQMKEEQKLPKGNNNGKKENT